MNLLDIKKLAQIKPDDSLVLSLFININAKERRHSDISTVVNHLIEEENKNLNINRYEFKHFKPNIERIREFFDSDSFVQKENRSVAIFSKDAIDFFKVIYLAQPLADRIVYSSDFLIRPLLGYLDTYGKYLALLVDQSRGKFFEIEQGKITAYRYFRDEVPNKVKEGGWYGYDEHHIERHIEDHLHQHYKKVAQKALVMLKKYNYDWLILAGQPETLAKFKKTLHSYTSQKLAAEIHINLTKAPTGEVEQQMFKAAEDVKRSEHENLTSEIMNKYPSKAALGFKEAEEALDRKAAYKLLMNTNLAKTFPTCNNCDYQAHEQNICPKCHADLSVLDEESNELVKKALFQNCEIHFLENELINRHQGIGALLRF